MSTPEELLEQLGVTNLRLRCANPACTDELPTQAGRGRPRLYCSSGCKTQVRSDRHIVYSALEEIRRARWPTRTDTATKRSVQSHLTALARQLGIAAPVNQLARRASSKKHEKPSSRNSSQDSIERPPELTDPAWNTSGKWEYVVQLTRGTFPFDVYLALDAAESARVTLEDIQGRLIAAEQRNPSIKNGPQYRIAVLASHLGAILEQLIDSISVPDVLDYERTFLQSPNYTLNPEDEERKNEEQRWISRHRREPFEPQAWVSPMRPSLREFIRSQATSASRRLAIRSFTATPRELEQDAMADLWELHKEELRERLYLEGRYDEVVEFEE